MCRYTNGYKQHYACFRCRKMFRQPQPWNLARPVELSDGEAREVTCPQCGSLMHNMGLDFKAPRQTDVKQWQKVEVLFQHGFTFHSCGCCGPGLRPAELKEVEAFLADHLPRSEGEKLLQRIDRATEGRERRKRQIPPGQSPGEHPLAADAARLRVKATAAGVAAALLRKKR